MKNTSKKAFTIVELVIVIAIIAILAGVLIPTFVGMIKKANQSSDTQLIRNLNTALAVEGALNGEPRNAYEAFTYAENQGYKVATIVAKSDYNIAYDIANARFVLLDTVANQYLFPLNPETNDVGSTVGNTLNYFVVCADDEEMAATMAKNYSVFWFNAEKPTVTDITVGFDAGYCTEIVALNYTNTSGSAQDVVIRTNGGELVINAKNDTVMHYGNASSVNIQAVNTSSYHEFGNVGFVEIAGGNLVVEATANVSDIHFDATYDAFVNNAGQKISVDLSKVSADMMPNFSRDPVEINQMSGTLVAKVTTSEEDYIWLTKSGVIERVTLSTSDTGAGSEYASKSDANYDIADQIANNAKRNNDGQLVDNTGAVIDMTAADWDSKVVQETAPTKEQVKAGLIFSGGKGTQERPYLIATAEQLMSINTHVAEGSYFELVNDIDITTFEWEPLGIATYEYYAPGMKHMVEGSSKSFKGNVNGNGYTVKIKIDDVIYNRIKEEKDYTNTTIALFPYIENSYIHDLVVFADINTTISNVGVAGLCGTAKKSTFKNITVNGAITGEIRASGFAEITYGATFENCTNNADITVKHTAGNKSPFVAGIVQQPIGDVEDSVLAEGERTSKFINCFNNGDLTFEYTAGQVGVSIGAIYSQGFNNTSEEGIVLQDCVNTGTLKAINKNNSNPNFWWFEGVIDNHGIIKNTYQSAPNKYKILVGGWTSGKLPTIIEKGQTIDTSSLKKPNADPPIFVNGD